MKHRTFAVALGLAMTCTAPFASAQSTDVAGAPVASPPSAPLPALPAPVDVGGDAVVPAKEAVPASLPDSDRGGLGESCRARVDCKSGLGCFNNLCAATCNADSECDSGQSCDRGACSARPQSESRATTIELDETFSTRTSPYAYYGSYNGYGGTSYGGGFPVPITNTEAVASSIVDLRHRIRNMELVATLPFGIETDSIGTGTMAGGNVALGFYVTEHTSSLRFRVGGALALPTAGTTGLRPTIEHAAAASRGFDRIWLWAPEYGAIAPSVLVGSNEGDVFQHATELALVPMVHVGSGSGPATFVAQLSEDIGAHVGLFRAGLRGEIVTITDEATEVQVSALPYVGIDGPGGFFDIGLRINLSEPAGFSFDETKYWGLRLRGGVRF